MSELGDLRERLKAKLGIKDRQLSTLITRKEGETLLPRRLATLALAAQHSIGINRVATEEELAQLRELPTRSPQPVRQSEASAAAPRRARAITPRPATTPPAPRRSKRARTVFVVHGRNEAIRRAMFSFLRAIGLEPVEWRKAIQLTGKPSPSISEILDAAFANAVAVVVLLTPDDEVRLLKPLRKSSDPAYERRLVGQARANVLFEAGLSFGHHADSTVLVQVGTVKPFSDVAGRHITRLTNSAESRSEFVTKLGNAGVDTNTSGTDWYTEGDFDLDGGTGGEGETAS